MRYKKKRNKSINYRRDYKHRNGRFGDNIKMDVGCIRRKIEDIFELAQYVVHFQVAQKGNKERMGVAHKEKIKEILRIKGRELNRNDRKEGRLKRKAMQ
jgi:hypothetical protein